MASAVYRSLWVAVRPSTEWNSPCRVRPGRLEVVEEVLHPLRLDTVGGEGAGAVEGDELGQEVDHVELLRGDRRHRDHFVPSDSPAVRV